MSDGRAWLLRNGICRGAGRWEQGNISASTNNQTETTIAAPLITNGQKQVSFSATNSLRFFRLRHP